MVSGSASAENENDDEVEGKEELVMKRSSHMRTPHNKDDGADSVLYDDDEMLHPHPQFWLFMYISEESVNVYLHHRYQCIIM